MNAAALSKIIAKANRLGMNVEFNNEDPAIEIMNDCKQYIIDNEDSNNKYLLIEGTYSRSNFSYSLPIGGHNDSTGDHYYNEKRRRWEHLDIDDDGQWYLVISK